MAIRATNVQPCATRGKSGAPAARELGSRAVSAARGARRGKGGRGSAPAQAELHDAVHSGLLAAKHHDLVSLHGTRHARLGGRAGTLGDIPVPEQRAVQRRARGRSGSAELRGRRFCARVRAGAQLDVARSRGLTGPRAHRTRSRCRRLRRRHHRRRWTSRSLRRWTRRASSSVACERGATEGWFGSLGSGRSWKPRELVSSPHLASS